MGTATEFRFGESGDLRFAHGGPLYVPNHVGPVTSVIEFKAAALQQLQSLEAELDSTGDFDTELSLEELKVFTEEELVEKALKEDFESIPGIAELSQDSQLSNDTDGGKEIACSENPAMENSTSGPCASLNHSSIVACSTNASEGRTQQKKRKKRGRFFDRNSRASELEGSYFAKVKQLAKIKQKQDENKLAARLHSFSGNSKTEGAITTTEKIERMKSLRFITSPAKVKCLNSRGHAPLCYPEVVLCVEIYCNKDSSQKNQEFVVLGSQLLTDFRDNIYCLTDRLMQTAGEHDPSGYFLIENTFCNDLRDPSAIDYSKPIFDWLENRKDEATEKWEHIMSGELKKKKQKELFEGVEIANLPNLNARDMHKTRFSDLQFRLGAGYLYCHQGNCKHIMVIRDMRLLHRDDGQSSADYPLRIYQVRPRPRKCSVCRIYLATKMTVDDKWAPKNPCYFCIHCYFLLHYKEDNSLLYPHVVFDYYHDNS